MIVPMKKVALIIKGDKKTETLKELRKLGILQIEIHEGSGEKLDKLKAKQTMLENAVFSLQEKKQKKQKETEEPPVDSNAIAESLGLPAGIPGGLESLPRGTGDGNGGGTMILE